MQKQDKSKTRVYAPGPHKSLPLGSGMAENARKKLMKRKRTMDDKIKESGG